MIEQETRPCALGLDTATLSALRDEALPAAELRRLQEHAATCESCQTRLSAFERIQRALRRQPELEPGNRIWIAVQARATNTSGRPGAHRDGFRPGLSAAFSPASLRGLAAAASILLVVGLLAIVLANASGNRPAGSAPSQVVSATATATANATPNAPPSATTNSSDVVPQLVWGSSQGILVANIAPSNGDVVYQCNAPAAGSSEAGTAVTQSRGIDGLWNQGGSIPVGKDPSSPSGSGYSFMCNFAIDASNPATAIVSVGWVPNGAFDPSLFADYVTFDFAAHWQKLTSPAHAFYRALQSDDGRMYALHSSPSSGDSFWVSTDRMASWTADDTDISAQIVQFWVNPGNGDLLVETNSNGTTNPLLYQSTDGGAHWILLDTPSIGAEGNWVVAIPQAFAAWQICGASAPPLDKSQPQVNGLTCTTDGGQTWTTRKALNLSEMSPKGFQYTGTAGVFAIANDGAVLATVLTQNEHVYRLPAGSSTWQDMGPLPTPIGQPAPAYFPFDSGSELWYSGESNVYWAYYSVT